MLLPPEDNRSLNALLKPWKATRRRNIPTGDGECCDQDGHSQLALSNGALIIAHGCSVSEVETKGKHAPGQDQ